MTRMDYTTQSAAEMVGALESRTGSKADVEFGVVVRDKDYAELAWMLHCAAEDMTGHFDTMVWEKAKHSFRKSVVTVKMYSNTEYIARVIKAVYDI